MKVCPVCNDSFEDDLNFCDVDGTPLRRDPSTAPPQNKTWSLLGVGLIVGAVVISAAAIMFLPKARVSPTMVSSSTPQPNAQQSKPAATEPADAAAAPDQSEPNTNVAPLVAKRQDKSQSQANGNASLSSPDPKAAALDAGAAEKTSPQPDAAVALPTVPARPEAPPAIETRPPEPKAVEPSAGKGEARPSSSSTKSSKDSDKKKDDGKDKEKKKGGGGFLKVFKKIFGKD